MEPGDLPAAQELVNSNGGDWGYVTVVIREDDLDFQKWQNFFDDCRRRHLIPIVRIATYMQSDAFWAKPGLDDLEKWPKFLNSLNWPNKQQIVIIFNEPNHNLEWGGEANPQEYALVLEKLVKLFKEKNGNFFVLPAGLDQACSNTAKTLDEKQFLHLMQEAVPEIFSLIDGWSSHSYPNLGFIGLPGQQGRATIRGYIWELDLLKSLGVEKDVPVYITETGWPHKEGSSQSNHFYSSQKTADYFLEAFAVWQTDNRVKAVTPFVLNYPLPPFANFSWLDKDGQAYLQYTEVLGISKSQNNPEQKEDYEIVNLDLPGIMLANLGYQGKITIKNTGQWIIGEKEFVLPIKAPLGLEISIPSLNKERLIEPGEKKTLDFLVKTSNKAGVYEINFAGHRQLIFIYGSRLSAKKTGSFWNFTFSAWN
ncbi:MAG: hypothetical protein ABIB61_03105 [Candidatus Shapirobacteria bacterium]